MYVIYSLENLNSSYYYAKNDTNGCYDPDDLSDPLGHVMTWFRTQVNNAL